MTRSDPFARAVWLAGCASAAVAVAAGAFGAHALRDRLGPHLLSIWETAARYQMYHSLGLLLVAVMADRRPGGAWRAPAALLSAGIVLFSGSLYALALTGIRPLGAITPLGGVCWLGGWILLARAGASPPSDASVR